MPDLKKYADKLGRCKRIRNVVMLWYYHMGRPKAIVLLGAGAMLYKKLSKNQKFTVEVSNKKELTKD